jgi:hypothetical protein
MNNTTSIDAKPNSVLRRFLGHRSLFSWIFGKFFANSTNTSGLLAISLVACIIYLATKGTNLPDRLLDAVFIIVGFYFGGATAKATKDDEEI